MKQLALGLAASLISATALLAQTAPPPTPPQNPPAQSAPQTKAPDVTLTGCLIQGSSPNVYILENAKISKDDTSEKARTFVLASAGEDLSFKPHLNHEVRVTGMADAKVPPTPPAGQKIDEKDLPKLTAKSVTMVADRCAPEPR